MGLPPSILRNTGAFLALVACLLSLAGLALSFVLVGSLYLSFQSAESALFAQLDSLTLSLSSAQAAVSSSADSSEEASSSFALISSAVSSYSDSSRNISESLFSIAAVPPFSLDSRFTSAAKSFRQAASYFGNASQSFSSASASAKNTSGAMMDAKESLGGTARSLEISTKEAKDAFFTFKMGLFAGGGALVVIFASVLLLSLSMLLSHYPHLFDKGNEQERWSERPHPPGAEPSQPQSQPPGYRQWQPGQSRPYDRERDHSP